jgi:predicted transposase YdaD
MLDSYFEQSAWYRIVLERGEKKGGEEGLQEGKEEALLETVRAILERRFPSLADATREQWRRSAIPISCGRSWCS